MEHTDLELYIQIRDGQPYEHPIFAENFRAAFPDVDTNNLPLDRFARFVRVDPPVIGTYEVNEGLTYSWVGDVVKDTYSVRPMTDAEREVKTEELRQRAYQDRDIRVRIIKHNITHAEDLDGQRLWQECLDAHELWVLLSVDPVQPSFPRFPIQDVNGNWVAPPAS